MISQIQAEQMFHSMVNNSGKNYRIERVWEISLEEPIYVMAVRDEEGKQVFPGEVFPSIRKSDGELVAFSFPSTG